MLIMTFCTDEDSERLALAEGQHIILKMETSIGLQWIRGAVAGRGWVHLRW